MEGETGGSRLIAIVTAPAFEATLTTPEQIQALTDEDLGDLAELGIEVDETPPGDTSRRIAVTITRPSPSTGGVSKQAPPPVVRLAVTGSDRDWVDLATLRMTELLNKGERATERVTRFVVVGFVVCLIAAIASLALGDEKEGLNAGEIATIVLFSLAGLGLVLIASISAITPSLELLPDHGATKWERMTQRFNLTGRWLLDAILKAAIGAGVVLVIGWLT